MKHRIVILAATLCIAGLISFVIFFRILFMGNVNQDKCYLYVPSGSTIAQVMDSLNTNQTLKNSGTFLRAAKWMSLDRNIKPGCYLLKKGMSNRSIIRMISNGWQTPVRLVIPSHVRGIEKLSSILGKRLEIDSIDIANSLINDTILKEKNLSKHTILTLFIPNTYEVYWTISAKELTERMQKESERFWTDERIEKAKKLKLDKIQAYTLASIVAEESNLKREQPSIAGVYLNRLRKGMLLQADPTVKFALNDPTIKRILNKHLKIDSPYNTYKYKGLPPGPITIPPVSAIDAVLSADNHQYLYFCAHPSLDGSHVFAKTLGEHNLNARRYQAKISASKR